MKGVILFVSFFFILCLPVSSDDSRYSYDYNNSFSSHTSIGVNAAMNVPRVVIPKGPSGSYLSSISQSASSPLMNQLSMPFAVSHNLNWLDRYNQVQKTFIQNSSEIFSPKDIPSNNSFLKINPITHRENQSSPKDIPEAMLLQDSIDKGLSPRK